MLGTGADDGDRDAGGGGGGGRGPGTDHDGDDQRRNQTHFAPPRTCGRLDREARVWSRRDVPGITRTDDFESPGQKSTERVTRQADADVESGANARWTGSVERPAS